MKIVINETPVAEETEIIINCKKTNEQILKIIAMLHAFDKKITGIRENRTYILDAMNILYIDTVDKRTFFYTETEFYETPLKLYELEERLAGSEFFRATKSSIINFHHIQSLKTEFGGRMQVIMSNGEKLLVSRQYVSNIKEKLELLT